MYLMVVVIHLIAENHEQHNNVRVVEVTEVVSGVASEGVKDGLHSLSTLSCQTLQFTLPGIERERQLGAFLCTCLIKECSQKPEFSRSLKNVPQKAHVSATEDFAQRTWKDSSPGPQHPVSLLSARPTKLAFGFLLNPWLIGTCAKHGWGRQTKVSVKFGGQEWSKERTHCSTSTWYLLIVSVSGEEQHFKGKRVSAYMLPMPSRMSPREGSMLTRKSMISPRSTKYDSRKSTKSLAPIPVMPMTIPRPVPTGASRSTCDYAMKTIRKYAPFLICQQAHHKS